jgi:triphosphoribosyl-dephospho-CoA synthase
MEVMSPKPGNVRPNSEFADSTVNDFLKSAEAIAPELALAETRPLGESILKAVEATRTVVSHNTNLGIILLIAPLAAVPPERSLFDGIGSVLSATTLHDSQLVYQAIRIAQPGGLGKVHDQDLQNEPTLTLQECMRLAADHDLIAAQYANGFRQVLNEGLEWLREAEGFIDSQPSQIAWLATRLLAEYGDSLIARKCGPEMSNEVRQKARTVLDSGWPNRPVTSQEFDDFDAFLRADGNQRNPGTTADMIAAILFAALRDGWMTPHERWLVPPK